MSTISDLLKNIMSARFGKDVRQSIHDAIEQCDNNIKQCYADATGNPASIAAHVGNTSNPHKVTAEQVGLDKLLLEDYKDISKTASGSSIYIPDAADALIQKMTVTPTDTSTTSVDITVCGKNLSNADGYRIGKAWNGSENNERASLIIKVEVGKKYYITLKDWSIFSSVGISRCSDNNFTDATWMAPKTGNSIVLLSDETRPYLIIQPVKSNITIEDIINAGIQFEIGEKGTLFEAYNGQSATIDIATQTGWENLKTYFGTTNIIPSVAANLTCNYLVGTKKAIVAAQDAVNSAQKEAFDSLQKSLDDMDGKYLFIGDSYGDASHWPIKLARCLGLSEDQYWDISKSSTCFAQGTWLNLLKDWADSNPDEVKNVRYIICGGGINDSSASDYPNLHTGISNFYNYMINTFPKKTEMYLAYFGWSLDTSPVIYGRNAFYRKKAQTEYARGRAYGSRCNYLSGCESVLHYRSRMGTDGLHPNDTAGDYIAESIANALKSGAAKCGSEFLYTTPVPVNGGTYGGSIYSCISGETLTVHFDDVSFSAVNLGTVSKSWVDVAELKLANGNSIPTFTETITIGTGAGYETLTATFCVADDMLKMKIDKMINNSWTGYNVCHIMNMNLNYSKDVMMD